MNILESVSRIIDEANSALADKARVEFSQDFLEAIKSPIIWAFGGFSVSTILLIIYLIKNMKNKQEKLNEMRQTQELYCEAIKKQAEIIEELNNTNIENRMRIEYLEEILRALSERISEFDKHGLARLQSC